MSETNQEVLGKTVAVLNELGVSAENSSKNIQFAIKVLGKTEKQAATLQRELITFAQDLGVSVDQMASDFASMGPQIAALGSKGVDAFRSLEVQAKNTGLQLSEILGLVEKFDTFDGAAQAVGKLNALLGGPYLNTLELVAETDPSKRFEILKDRVDAGEFKSDYAPAKDGRGTNRTTEANSTVQYGNGRTRPGRKSFSGFLWAAGKYTKNNTAIYVPSIRSHGQGPRIDIRYNRRGVGFD